MVNMKKKPRSGTAGRKTTLKATARKPGSGARAAVKPAAGKSPAAKRTAAKSPAAKRTAAKSPAAKRTAAKSPAAKRTAAKSPAAKRTAAKSPAAKRTAAKSPAAKRTAAKSGVAPTPAMPPAIVPGGDRRRRRRPLQVITRASDLQSRMVSARSRGLTIGFVPTMGALHAGHAALLDEARRRADILVASVFVNPKQFGPREDYTRYPRPIDDDKRLCEGCGVDILFAPQLEEMYPVGFDTHVRAGSLAQDLEGAARPGHFDGMLTVVLALLSIAQPHFAVFGEKDFQQLSLVRRMVRDLRLTVEIVPMPVIRDVDGLALSSRNAYLSPEHRAHAVALYRALMAAQDEAQRGVTDTARFKDAALAVLCAVEGMEVDYVEVRDPRTLAPVATLEQEARLLIAARLGGIRLIDNGPLFAGVRFP